VSAVKRELAAIHEAIGAAAQREPTVVLLAMVDELVDAACGANPALKDAMRLHFYRKFRARLHRLGVL